MLWAQMCVLLGLLEMVRGLLAKTHAKAAQTKVRADLLAPVAATANTLKTQLNPITSVSGKATYLATLTQQSAPAGAGGLSLSYTGPADSLPAIFSWLETGGSFDANLWTPLYDYVVALGDVCNNIIDNLGDFNAW
jgi:hypothetical protein